MDKKFKIGVECIVPGKLPFLRSSMYLVHFQAGEFQILHLSFLEVELNILVLSSFWKIKVLSCLLSKTEHIIKSSWTAITPLMSAKCLSVIKWDAQFMSEAQYIWKGNFLNLCLPNGGLKVHNKKEDLSNSICQ